MKLTGPEARVQSRALRNSESELRKTAAGILEWRSQIMLNIGVDIADIRISETEAWHIPPTLIGQIQKALRLLD